MKELSKLILSLGCVAIVGACAPHPPQRVDPLSQTLSQQEQPQSQTQSTQSSQQTAADVKQRKIDESRRRLAREKASQSESVSSKPRPPSLPVKPVRPSYPTATAVPGKEGFVFNPYTQNIVDVKGIGSGKLVRDPEDVNSTHKFRVP